MTESFQSNHRSDAEPRDFLLNMLPKQSIGAEIGVHLGDFSRRILHMVHPRELHLIDPWKHETRPVYQDAWYGGKAENGQQEMDERFASVCGCFSDEIGKNQIKIHRGYSSDILKQFPEGYFDWIYIDGNHLYQFVKQDIELSFQKVKLGGLVTGDDYQVGGWWNGGVKKAVDEFARRHSTELLTIQKRQYVFRKTS
ncbi:MAG: class I SAM-dependent methyltransferase [Methylococcaceae bacterium]|nr:MAG: class I SAM-dependent methyltransferase [Methylococcaceae bacterium]